MSRMNSLSRTEPRWMRAIHTVSLCSAAAAGLVLVVMGIATVLNVTTRAFARQPIPGILELTAGLWMPLVVALAFGAMQLRGERIEMRMLVDAAGGRIRRLVDIVVAGLIVVTFAALTYYSGLDAWQSTILRQATTGALAVPMWVTKIVITVAMVLATLEALISLINLIRGRDPIGLHPEESELELEAL